MITNNCSYYAMQYEDRCYETRGKYIAQGCAGAAKPGMARAAIPVFAAVAPGIRASRDTCTSCTSSMWPHGPGKHHGNLQLDRNLEQLLEDINIDAVS